MAKQAPNFIRKRLPRNRSRLNIRILFRSPQLLPRRARHHRGVRRDRPGVLQQRQAVAPGDRQVNIFPLKTDPD